MQGDWLKSVIHGHTSQCLSVGMLWLGQFLMEVPTRDAITCLCRSKLTTTIDTINIIFNNTYIESYTVK